MGGEGSVVACGDGVGGGGEEGGDRERVVEDGGELQGSFVVSSGYAQRQRVLADLELENGGVAVVASSVMKGIAPIVAGDGQQAPLPRVELGLRYHQLHEFHWRRQATDVYDARPTIVLSWNEMRGATAGVSQHVADEELSEAPE